MYHPPPPPGATTPESGTGGAPQLPMFSAQEFGEEREARQRDTGARSSHEPPHLESSPPSRSISIDRQMEVVPSSPDTGARSSMSHRTKQRPRHLQVWEQAVLSKGTQMLRKHHRSRARSWRSTTSMLLRLHSFAPGRPAGCIS